MGRVGVGEGEWRDGCERGGGGWGGGGGGGGGCGGGGGAGGGQMGAYTFIERHTPSVSILLHGGKHSPGILPANVCSDFKGLLRQCTIVGCVVCSR